MIDQRFHQRRITPVARAKDIGDHDVLQILHGHLVDYVCLHDRSAPNGAALRSSDLDDKSCKTAYLMAATVS